MKLIPPMPLPHAFKAAWKAAHPPQGIAVVAMDLPGVGLGLRVTRLPLAAFTTAFLDHGPGRWPLLSAYGEAVWETLFAVGRAAVAVARPPAGNTLVALILDPAAIERARAERGLQSEAA